MSNDEIILHHYPQSPVSEKIRVVFGMLGASWASVEIPRLPPKPNLMPLTGGYRLTPVMQIGADVYCDTHCILRELSRRFPRAEFFDDLAWGLSRWTDGPLFQDVVTVALVEMSPTMPPQFLADRGPLYFGPDYSLDDLKARYPDSLANIRAQFSWLNDHLGGAAYLGGITPGMADALAYYLVWFLRDRLSNADAFLAPFADLMRWAGDVKAIGHGTVTTMSDLDALDIALAATPQTAPQEDPGDPQGLTVGTAVTVTPATGGAAVAGTVRSLSANTVALLRDDDRAGQVCVHFPRVGYSVRNA